MQLHRAREQFEAAGVNLVLIGQATPRHAAHFRRRQGIELPVLADEQRASYKAAGAKVATIGELLGPKVVAKAFTATAKTAASVQDDRPSGAARRRDGDRHRREVAWSHMAQDASDNASPEEILAALRALG